MNPSQPTTIARHIAVILKTPIFLGLTLTSLVPLLAGSLVIEGVHVVPHVQSKEMRYRKPTDFSLGARVELFLKNHHASALRLPSDLEVRVRDKTPGELLKSDEWAWHDLPSAWDDQGAQLPPNAMTVWSWNGKQAPWGLGTEADLTVKHSQSGMTDHLKVSIVEPKVWVSSITFLGDSDDHRPDTLIFHVANESSKRLRLKACRLWLPKNNKTWRTFFAQPWLEQSLERFPTDSWIPAHDRGGIKVSTGPLPLTYGVLEVQLVDEAGEISTLWAHQRIKRELFDIGGGWIAGKLGNGNALHALPYLQTLARMHINSGMHQHVAGYSDTALFDQYPFKYMNRLQPIEQYDKDEVLPRIHAVEFLGEPQYGGGRPVPPQDVWKAFTPYAPTRLPTSVTHSEERIWRFYAGLSDFPHYDAYRVNAPSPDSWSRYDRWEGERIRWGAPLETIGTMTRSLRELNRPRPIAYWSQGANRWGRYGGRQRNSPTPDELRAQAYHGLAARITSLYWFNLSLKSLVQFRDLIEPITQVNRECLLLADLLIEGDAYQYHRDTPDGQPSWDLSSITGPRGGVLIANDLRYKPNHDTKEFEFRKRTGVFRFKLPAYLTQPAAIFKLGADGLHEVDHEIENQSVLIRDELKVAGIYVVSPTEGLRESLSRRFTALRNHERRHDFDPATNDRDFESLRQLLEDFQ